MKLKDITSKQMHNFCKKRNISQPCQKCPLLIEKHCMMCYMVVKEIHKKHENDEIKL